VTPRNTEYTKYDPPGAQVSDDALAQKYLLYTPPARLKLRYRSLRAYFFNFLVDGLIPFIPPPPLDIPNRLADEVLANNGNSDDEIMVAKKMPKMRKIFGRSQKRGGDRKLGYGVDGLEYVPPVAAARVADPVAQDTKQSIKYIPKKNLLRQWQQMEVTCLCHDLCFALIFVRCVKLTVNHSILS
jgi:hypothetical protein